MPPKAMDERQHRGRTKRGGRDGMWEAMRKLHRFTALDIEHQTRCVLGTIKTYLQSLKKAGFIEIVDHVHEAKHGLQSAGKWKAAVYELKRDSLDTPRVKRNGEVVTMGTGREQMWRTMRAIKVFTYIDLALHSSTEECLVSEPDARHYIKYLKRAGYIVEIEKAKPPKPARYQFVPGSYTGPRPPMVQRTLQVYDPNINAVVWPVQDEACEP